MGTRIVSEWELSTGSEYKKILGDLESRISSLTENTVALTVGTGAGALTAGQYYFDEDAYTLYLRCSDSGNPNTKTIRIYTYYLVFGAWGTQSEINNNELHQGFKSTSNCYLRYVKTWVLLKNNVSLSTLKLEIHPDLNGVPTEKVLFTSENTYASNTDITTDNTAEAELWFRFNNVPIKASEYYHIVLKTTGTFTDASHLAWLKCDVVYSVGQPTDQNAITEGSYRYTLIGKNA